jgi:hypothetical protein
VEVRRWRRKGRGEGSVRDIRYLILLQRCDLVEVCGGKLRMVRGGGRGEDAREVGGTSTLRCSSWGSKYEGRVTMFL